MNCKKMFFLAICMVMLLGTAWAQCEKCPETSGQKPDFCYTSDLFPDKCVQFTINNANCTFYPSAKAKTPWSLRILSEINEESLAAVIKQESKLSAQDLAFLIGAYQKWNTARLDLGFTFLPNGLGYKLVQEGDGKLPEKNKKVKVHYKGYLEDGTQFDSSFDRNEPIEITLGVGQVIKGWDEGIGLFKVGSKGVLKIPSTLGYGSRGVGSIPPNATLFFDIEVISAE